jgi:dUTP pyrophosphatase
MKVRVINKSDNDLPSYETIGSAGCDVRSNHDATINPGHKLLVKTGLYVEIPIGYEIQVRPRSGLAFSKGITVLNSPGTIDADYRGEIGVILINHGDEQVILDKGERIGQLVLNKVEQINWESVLVLSDTTRGSGGFGSTGKK